MLANTVAAQPAATEPDPALLQRIAEEIESIVPRAYADGSEEKQLVQKIATAYLQRKVSVSFKLLDELSRLDQTLPPRNLILAAMAFATNNPLQGRNLLERVGADHREHPGVSLAFSRLALLQGRYFEAMSLALACNEFAKSSNNEEVTKKYYITESCNTMTVIELRRNDLDRAEEWARKWAELDPTSNEMLIASAEIAFQRGDYEKSEQQLRRRDSEAVSELPTEVILAKWFRAKSDYKLLEKWATDANQKYPENPVVQLEYAGWLLRCGRYDEVEKIVVAFESKNGESLDSASLRGRLAFGRQQFAKATADFARIYQQQPNNFENSSLYVFALLETGSQESLQQAFGIAQRNYQAFPNSQLAVLAMSNTLAKMGRAAVADQLLERAARMGNIMPDTAYFMAEKLNREERGLQAKIMLDSFMDSRDTFIYREKAKALIESIGTGDATLPEPDKQ